MLAQDLCNMPCLNVIHSEELCKLPFGNEVSAECINGEVLVTHREGFIACGKTSWLLCWLCLKAAFAQFIPDAVGKQIHIFEAKRHGCNRDTVVIGKRA